MLCSVPVGVDRIFITLLTYTPSLVIIISQLATGQLLRTSNACRRRRNETVAATTHSNSVTLANRRDHAWYSPAQLAEMAAGEWKPVAEEVGAGDG
jgi:hypothetical protein